MLGVVVHGPSIQYHDGVFGDEVAVVREVFARDMRSAQPKGIVAAFDLCGGCQPPGLDLRRCGGTENGVYSLL